MKIPLEKIEQGISAYYYEQKVLLRLIKFKKGLSQDEFDRIFLGRECRGIKKLSRGGVSGDSFLLGIGGNGFNEWAWWLDLLQHMMAISLITTKRVGDRIVYLEGL